MRFPAGKSVCEVETLITLGGTCAKKFGRAGTVPASGCQLLESLGAEEMRELLVFMLFRWFQASKSNTR